MYIFDFIQFVCSIVIVKFADDAGELIVGCDGNEAFFLKVVVVGMFANYFAVEIGAIVDWSGLWLVFGALVAFK